MTRGISKYFSCFYDILLRELINSHLNKGLAAAALSMAVHVCTGFPCVCIILCVRAHMRQCSVDHGGPGHGHGHGHGHGLVGNTGKITKGLFFIDTKQEQFGHIL